MYLNFYRDPPSQDWLATWRDHGHVVWQITASADSRAYQADFERMTGQGFRPDMISVR